MTEFLSEWKGRDIGKARLEYWVCCKLLVSWLLRSELFSVRSMWLFLSLGILYDLDTRLYNATHFSPKQYTLALHFAPRRLLIGDESTRDVTRSLTEYGMEKARTTVALRLCGELPHLNTTIRRSGSSTTTTGAQAKAQQIVSPDTSPGAG